MKCHYGVAMKGFHERAEDGQPRRLVLVRTHRGHAKQRCARVHRPIGGGRRVAYLSERQKSQCETQSQRTTEREIANPARPNVEPCDRGEPTAGDVGARNRAVYPSGEGTDMGGPRRQWALKEQLGEARLGRGRC